MSINHSLFISPSYGPMRFSEVLKKIVSYIGEDPHREYKIIVGTDSTARSETVLVSVIIVHRIQNGAIYFYTKSPLKTFKSLRDRIFDEAMASITLGQELRSGLRELCPDAFAWNNNEIHVDIGENGPTKELIEAISGMIKGYQFIPVIKPLSFGAFAVADRHTA